MAKRSILRVHDAIMHADATMLRHGYVAAGQTTEDGVTVRRYKKDDGGVSIGLSHDSLRDEHWLGYTNTQIALALSRRV